MGGHERKKEQRDTNQSPGTGHSSGCSVLCTQLVSSLDALDQTEVLSPLLSGQSGTLGQQFSNVSSANTSGEDRQPCGQAG